VRILFSLCLQLLNYEAVKTAMAGFLHKIRIWPSVGQKTFNTLETFGALSLERQFTVWFQQSH